MPHLPLTTNHTVVTTLVTPGWSVNISGDLALQGLLVKRDTRFVAESLLRELDPELGALRNLNRPEDL